MNNLEGLTLTSSKSYATVILTKKPSGFLVEFPKNPSIFGKLMNTPGVLFGEDSPYGRSFYVPRNQLENLKRILGDKATWRDPNELQVDLDFQKQEQEALQDVLTRVPKKIDTSYMKIDPYPFQKLAVAWAAEDKGVINGKGVKCGILADQVGLGKTIESLATAGYFKEKGWIKNCLVITPAVIKPQFQQELEKFTNEKSIMIQSKSKGFKDRKKLYDRIREEKPFFTLINYELLYQREVVDTVVVSKDKNTGKEKMKKVFGEYLDLNEINDIGYDMVLIDEAHRMKNPNTEVAKAIRQIDVKYKLLMTGTPIQKELKNIFQLFDFIDPSILSDASLPFEERKEFFERQFIMKRVNPFIKLPKNLDNLKDELFEIFGEINGQALRKRINPFILRRLTEDVSDEMPTEIIREIVVEFNSEQLELLDKITETIEQYEKEIEKEKELEKREMLENMMKGLIQTKMVVCNSPDLLLESESNLIKRLLGKKKKFKQVQKVEMLLTLIDEITSSGDKVVVFTKYARMADLIQKEVTKLFEKKAKEEKSDVKKSYVYKGQTPTACKYRDDLERKDQDPSMAVCLKDKCPFFDGCGARTKLAYIFQNEKEHTGIDNPVLICTDAANSGINLQKAKYLINVDFPEAFSIYLQRNGRIRRLGSEHKSIFIYNLMTMGGKDESVYKAIKKQIELNKRYIENQEADNEAIKKANEEIAKEFSKR